MQSYINWWLRRYENCKRDPLSYPVLWVGYVYLMHWLIRKAEKWSGING